MERSPRARKMQINLSQSLERRLNSYTLAASAAGVAVLALAQPAEAKIVYTKAHEVLGRYGLRGYIIDLNHDGIGDFGLNLFIESATWWQTLQVGGGTKNEILIGGKRKRILVSRAYYPASALKAGSSIGAKGQWETSGRMVHMVAGTQSSYQVSGGNWANVNNRYLGLKFLIKGKVHYGWARLSVRAQHTAGITAFLTGYAYETIPNKPIIAGRTHGADYAEQPAPASFTTPAEKPASLGWLAQGAPGLSIWKRQGSPEAAQR